MSAPDRIWLTIDRRGKITGCPDAHVEPCAEVAGDYVAYTRATSEADELRAECEILRTEKHADAEAIGALRAEVERLREALLVCQAEIDGYIQHEYPSDHPVHQRYRKRDFEANPARIALKGADQ